VISKLSPFLSHYGGPEHLRALAFFDQLVGKELVRLPRIPAGAGYPGCTCLDFEDGYFAIPIHDADNSPGPVRWQVLAESGLAIPGLHLRKLVGRRVTGHGFFQLVDDRERTLLPFLRLGDDAHLTCVGSPSGAVISLEQGPRTEWLHLKLP